MIEKLHESGLKSEYAYIAGFASIGLATPPTQLAISVSM